jgi:septum formation protein
MFYATMPYKAPIILASTSGTRRQLLTRLNVPFDVISQEVDESPLDGESPQSLARRLARQKSSVVATQFPHAIVIGADQVLEFQGQAFGKADDRTQAGQRLKLFAGHSHQLHSALSLAVYQTSEAPRLLHSQVVTAQLTMRPLSEAEIEAYLDSGEWEGCAGCYQYENRGAQLFKQVQGEQSTIMGLPIVALLEALRGLGLNTLTAPHGPWDID